MIEIKRSPTGDVLMRLEADTLAGVNLHGAALRGADLSGVNLRGANLGQAALRGADLSDACLDRANLEGANLLLVNMRRASLREANVRGAMMEGAVLTNADLRGADLSLANLFGAPMAGAYYDERTKWPANFNAAKAGARMVSGETPPPMDPQSEKGPCPHCGSLIFRDAKKCRFCGLWLHKSTLTDDGKLQIFDASGKVMMELNAQTLQGIDLAKLDLRGANLINANLRGARLRGIDLARAQLMGANLEGALLGEANLSGANMREANLTGAELPGAVMRGTSLEKAILTGADLSRANLREANLAYADLRGADFFGANLYGVNLQEIKHDQKTCWPEGLDPCSLGAPRVVGAKPAASAKPAPVAAPSPAVGAAKSRASAPDKTECPFCAETILADAVKCRYCGEWLGRGIAPPAATGSHGLALGAAVAAMVILAALIGALLLKPELFSKPAAPVAHVAAGAPEAYSIKFPEASIGVLSARTWGSTEGPEGWTDLGEARGRVTIPSGKELKLTLAPGASDLSSLRGLAPGDLHTLDLLLSSANDEQLACIEGLTGLRDLALPNTVTDAGLAHLKGLVALRSLNLADTGATDAGLASLEGMRSLVYLLLPKGIGDEALARVKGALPACNVQRFE